MATRDGLIKKTPYSEFANLRKTGLIAIVLREDDELIGVELTSGDDEIAAGHAARAWQSASARRDIRPMGRDVHGREVHAAG